MAKLNVVGVEKGEKSKPIEPEPVKLLPAPKITKEDLPVYKEDEFEIFLAWYSVPAFFRHPPIDKKSRQRPSVRDFCESIGVDDEQTILLAEIPSMSAFAETYKVHINTLTDWRKLIHERDMLQDIRTWAKPLTRNVMMSLYNACLRGGLPDHYKLWLQSVADYSEKTQIDIRKRQITTIEYEIVDKTSK